MKITTVFFDLGDTLVYSRDPWPPLYDRADRTMTAVLQQGGIPLNVQAFASEYGGFMAYYYQKEYKDNIEPTSTGVLREILVQKGFPAVPEALLREAVDALHAVVGRNWHREEDAIQTLDALKTRGYRLGIISNTSDDHHVQEILQREGLRPFFETVITSAALGIRKPDRRIFEVALDRFKVNPGETAMLGDILTTDILGANGMGIYSIWITRHARTQKEGELAIQPQAVVSALDQLPFLLDEINGDRTPRLA